MKSIFISQSNYLPWIGYFDAINVVDEFHVYDVVQFTRRDWRNRNTIKTSSGLQWLTIPVQQKSFYQPICETITASNAWQRKHMQALRINYGKAPYFHWVMEHLQSCYESQEENLTKINRQFLTAICQMLQINTAFTEVSNAVLSITDRTDRLLHLCHEASASRYVTGPAAKAYIKEEAFAAAGIELCYLRYDGYTPYQQSHPPFTWQVSIVDLLMHTGPAARDYLLSNHSPSTLLTCL